MFERMMRWCLVMAGLFALAACAEAQPKPVGFAPPTPAPTSEEIARQLGGVKEANPSVVFSASAYAPADLSLATLEGRPVSLRDLRGKVLLLDFFTTYAAPSQAMMKIYEELVERYEAKGFAVIGISLDLNGPELLKMFIEELGVRYPVFVARGETKEGKTPYGYIQEVPSCLLIDGQGRLVKAHKGLLKRELLESEIKALLGK